MEFIVGFILGCFVSAFIAVGWHKHIIQDKLAELEQKVKDKL